MNWQWVSTRPTASSIDLPSRAPLRADIDEGHGFRRHVLVHGAFRHSNRGDQPTTRRGPFGAAAVAAGFAGRFQASDRDFEACDTLVAAHGWDAAGAHRAEEGDQFGAQRLVMADRKVAHRIGAVGLEAEAFGDLPRQQVAHHIFVARRHRDVARLERGQPVGVDLREHARGGAELQQRDVFTLGDCARQLRLHFDDVGLGEPADQVDVVHGEIDDDADIGHPRRERPDPGDRDGENVLARQRLLDGGDGRIEALDMPDHQRDAGTARGGDDLASLRDAGGDRLLDQDVDLARDAGERDLVMQMRGCGDGDGIDALGEQLVEGLERTAAGEIGGPRSMLRPGDRRSRPA